MIMNENQMHQYCTQKKKQSHAIVTLYIDSVINRLINCNCVIFLPNIDNFPSCQCFEINEIIYIWRSVAFRGQEFNYDHYDQDTTEHLSYFFDHGKLQRILQIRS